MATPLVAVVIRRGACRSRAEKDVQGSVEITEWHRVGPGLMALIVCLALRMRLSRARIREFLGTWLGVTLATGTLNQCVHEAAHAVLPVEEELVDEVNRSELLHGDETSWKEAGKALWLWVFTSTTVTFYLIGYRTREFLDHLLGEAFTGWLMSDGYRVYRAYTKRLRCWAHLVRKARGLAESWVPSSQRFGQQALDVLQTLMQAVYEARESPGGGLKAKYPHQLDTFRACCERYQDADHEKTRALAREFLKDWEAIFAVLSHPHLPLTNNHAERALRHWVILRKLSLGTRSEQGSRALALLASVIDTCRQRGVSPWTYLAEVIRLRRQGLDAPALPTAA
ncbi:MAG: IS66 family transposase [Gammaproteobacteria bacterium]